MLGGGPAAIAAAFELSAPELAGRFEVTVYQPGWRLGGKCASGRNLAEGGRIEEHGLHVWFGFYDNSFAMIRAALDELDRPPEHPLGTLEQAFEGCDDLVMCDTDAGGPRHFHVTFPRNGHVPGSDHPLPDFWEITFTLCNWALRRWRSVRPPGAGAGGSRRGLGGETLLRLARRLAAGMRRSGRRTGAAERLVAALLTRFRDWLWERVVRTRCEQDARLRVFFTAFDTLATTIAGIVADGVLDRGWDVINDRDLCDWLVSHGAKEVTVGATPAQRAPLLRAVYDLAFAYPGGEISAADAAAGTAASNLLRLLFAYRGSVLYKMRAGMGDTVVAPMYELLRRRGVRFEFFHAATDLRLSPDGSSVEAIEIVRQAGVLGETYEPLIPVGALECWPSEPLWEQLEQGELLREQAIDFELDPNPLARSPHLLRHGESFDDVVLGVPVSALDGICSEIAGRHERFAAMLDASSTVATQSFQLWLTRPPSRLGWRYGANSVAETPDGRLSTWCDMTYLLDAEDHVPEEGIRGLAYFCGVLADSGPTGARAAAGVRDEARLFLERHLGSLWPGALTRDPGGSVQWTILADRQRRCGADRLEAQYWRANTTGSDRYVLTPAGSVSRRLASDESGVENLVLAGDWTRSGIDGGCVEAAVTSGMQAARALIGHDRPIRGESTTWLTDRAAAGATRSVGWGELP